MDRIDTANIQMYFRKLANFKSAHYFWLGGNVCITDAILTKLSVNTRFIGHAWPEVRYNNYNIND